MKKLLLPLASLFCLSVSSLTAQTSGNLTAERWNNLPANTSVLTLQKDGIANRAADATSLLAGAEWAPNQGDDYGVRLRGTVTAPVTGSYTFYIAGDNSAELLLSTDSSRFNKKRIAWEYGWTSVNQWNKYSSQRSKPVQLIAGQKYYIEALMMESYGGDNLSIGWSYETPASLTESAIGANVTQTWSENNGTHTLDVEAGDIWGTADSCAFKHRSWSGDGEFITHIDAMNNPYMNAKVGLMVRASLDADSAYAMIARTGNCGMAFQRRIATSNASLHTGNPSAFSWLRLVRKGDVISAYVSSDGVKWILVGEDTLPSLPSSVFVGLCATDNLGSNHVTATIDNFSCQTVTASEVIPAAQLESIAPNANDADDDNLPDDWETANGLDPTSALGNNGQYGDFDNDGINNFTEYQLGTTPASKEALLDSLTRERWTSISGNRITDLTLNRSRFLHQPNEIIQVPNVDELNYGDNYATRYRGTITAPVTGDYTFWISGDDEAELWLSDGSVVKNSTPLINKFGKQKIAWIQDQRFGNDYTSDEDFDRFASQRSRTITLTAGQHYYIEVLHKEGTGNDHVTVAWQVPGSQREIIPASAFASDVPEDDDPDDDFLPSAWETQYGLNPDDNGITDARDGQYGDWDADGLNNFTEYQLGTDPTNADTDGDGLSDLEERDYYGTDPLVSNALASNLHTQMTLGTYQSSSNAWEAGENGELTSTERRGYIDYSFTVATGEEGIFEIRITGGAVGQIRSVENLPLEISLNSEIIGKTKLTSVNGASSTIKHLTPWLSAGDYTLRIRNTNYRALLKLRLDSVEVYRLGGVDVDGNGIADWVEQKITDENFVSRAPVESLTSPVCVEGVTPSLSTFSLTKLITDAQGQSNSEPQEVLAGINDGFFSNVPLNPTGNTELTFNFQNGAITETRQVTWIATNILTRDTLTIRKGDSLKLTAFDGNTASGTFSLTTDTSFPGDIQGHLPTSDTVTAWTDKSLSTLTVASGTIQGAWITATPATAYHISINGDTATLQLQCIHGGYTKVTKVELKQVGNDITAKQLYARYKAGNHLGEDFDSNGATSAPNGADGYGVSALALTLAETLASSQQATVPAIYLFDTAGTHTFEATWLPDGGGQPFTSTLAVTVKEADFGDPLDVMAWNRRIWEIPGVGSDMDVSADDTLSWNETTQSDQNIRSFIVDVYETGTRHVIARLPETGEIIARGTIKGFYVASVDETSDAQLVAVEADGTRRFRYTIAADGLPANAEIRLKNYFQGAAFLDGGNELVLTADDFNTNGIADVYIEWGPDGTPRLCHTLDVFLMNNN